VGIGRALAVLFLLVGLVSLALVVFEVCLALVTPQHGTVFITPPPT